MATWDTFISKVKAIKLVVQYLFFLHLLKLSSWARLESLPAQFCPWLYIWQTCFEGFFLNRGNISVIVHFSSLLWSFNSFGIAVLASAFLLLCWFVLYYSFCYFADRFVEVFQNNDAPFILLTCHEIIREPTSPGFVTPGQWIVRWIFSLWKFRTIYIPSVNVRFFNFLKTPWITAGGLYFTHSLTI